MLVLFLFPPFFVEWQSDQASSPFASVSPNTLVKEAILYTLVNSIVLQVFEIRFDSEDQCLIVPQR